MPGKIVVGFDGTRAAREAVARAIRLGTARGGAEIVFVCTQHRPPDCSRDPFTGRLLQPGTWASEWARRVARGMEHEALRVRLAGLDASVVCAYDDADGLLIAAAESRAIDCPGSTGRQRPRRSDLGCRSREMDERTSKLVTELIAPLRVPPGMEVKLERDFDPAHTAGFLQKEEGEELLQHGVELLAEYQTRLAAQDTYGLLVVIQGIDAGGKDGTIKHVMTGVNPQGVSVHSFKAPSAEELDHDFLWRCAQRLPARGEIAIFNRSHYEEVLVVRVHPEYLARQRLPEASTRGHVWTRRYREINDWERYLFDYGFRVVKLFLNISKEEQRRRFLDRIDEAEKNWKFSVGDAKERDYWDAYQEAFSAMLSATSTEWAPWYVIPGDHKWFARIAAAGVIAKALIDIDPRYAVLDDAAQQALLEARAALVAEASGGAAPQAGEGAAPEAGKDEPAAASADAATQAAKTGGGGAPDKGKGNKGKKRGGKKRK